MSDTPDPTGDYLKNMAEDFKAIVGTPDQVDALLKHYWAAMLLAERKLNKNEWNIGQVEAQENAASAELKAKLSALLVEARLDELRVEEASRQRGGGIPMRLTNRIYELEKELRELEKQMEVTE